MKHSLKKLLLFTNFFLPFEKYVIRQCSVNDCEESLANEIDRTKLMDIYKKFVLVTKYDKKLVLKTNLGFIIKTQKYFFSETNENTNIIARNNLLVIFIYCLIFVVFFYGFISSLIQYELIKSILTLIWFVCISTFINGIQKYFRMKDIDKIEDKLQETVIRIV